MDDLSCLMKSAHCKGLNSGFCQFYEDDVFSDVTIRINSCTFRCHKVILSMFSAYFKTMFTLDMKEKYQNEIILHGIPPRSFEKTLNFIYNAGHGIVQDDIVCLLHAAVYLQIQSLQEMCEQLLCKTINPINIVELWRTSKHVYPHLKVLHQACEDYLLRNYLEYFSEDSVIEQLSASELEFLVSNNSIRVPSEEHFVKEFIVRWFQYDMDTRTEHLFTIFRHVRLLTMDNQFLKNQFPFWTQASMSSLLEEVTCFFDSPGDQINFPSPRLKLRLHDTRTLALIVFGTSDGFIPENSLWKYENGTWFELPSYANCISNYALCRYGLSSLLISGGLGINNQSQKFVEFDFNSNTWKRKVSIPPSMERMYHCMVVVKTSVFIFGGYFRGNDLLSVCKIDFQSAHEDKTEWKTCGNLLRCVTKDRQAVSSGDNIIIYEYDSCQCYNTKTNTCINIILGIPLNKTEPIYTTGCGTNMYVLNGRNLYRFSEKDISHKENWNILLSDFQYNSFDNRRDIDVLDESLVVAGTLRDRESDAVKRGIVEFNVFLKQFSRDLTECIFIPADIRCRYMVVSKTTGDT